MRGEPVQSLVWELARKQHGLVARRQLLDLGLSPKAIECGLAAGRLHRTAWRAVYLVGRPELTEYGRIMAPVLWAGPDAVLSHLSAAWLWRIRNGRTTEIHLSMPAVRRRTGGRGVTVHRRRLSSRDVTRQRGIPVTTPIRTLIDLAATTEDRHRVERDLDQADARNLVKAEALRAEVEAAKGQPGVPLLREILDRGEFVLTDSVAERLLVPIARRVGLPRPETQAMVNGHRVDFYFRELDAVVEVNGHRYHRTALEQERDMRREHAHAAAGTQYRRLSYWQVARDAGYVEAVLRTLRRRAAAA
jgi:very-short-patch-repair endonuclease